MPSGCVPFRVGRVQTGVVVGRRNVFLTEVQMNKAAIAALEVALDVCVNNEPINRKAGKVAQADLEKKNAAAYRRAIKKLSEK